MPRISQFYGIVIAMFYDDHEPPHKHAIYAEHRALVRIDDAAVTAGELPRRASSLVREWATLHKQELIDDWELARQHAALRPIARLD
jgi:hypothetical protein